MNPFLAEMYNTAENIGSGVDDQVKLAEAAVMEEAQMLDGLLADEGINMDNLDGTTIAKVAEAIFGEDSAILKVAKDEKEGETTPPPFPPKKKEKEEKEEESEEKMAEADFLGRMMAHAYVDELTSIEKDAAIPAGAVKALKGLVSKAKDVGTGAGKAVSEKAKRMGRTYSRSRLKMDPEGTWESAGRLKSLAEVAKKHPKTVAGLGMGAAGVAGAGAGAALSKKSSANAFDKLAEDRALEILKEAGVEIEATGPVEPSEEEKLAAAIDKRAWELLGENGFLEE